MDLSSVLAADRSMQQIENAGHIVAHIGGDCGGAFNQPTQQIVERHLERDFESPNVANHPAFLYLLGDIVYYNAETQYEEQFYLPYENYLGAIVSVPGNHDVDIDFTNPRAGPTLDAWMRNFCSTTPVVADGPNHLRTTMTQPGPYWTLETPYMRFIGLYSNVPEGGAIDDTQAKWLAGELSAARQAGIPAAICLHHPPYSLDDEKCGSEVMIDVITRAVNDSGNQPHAVFAAHAHNYQRFTLRTTFGNQPAEIPYLVVGALGFPLLTSMSQRVEKLPTYLPNHPGLSLDSFADDQHGYMRLDLSSKYLIGDYFTVPEAAKRNHPAVLRDSFVLDLAQRRVVPSGMTATSAVDLFH